MNVISNLTVETFFKDNKHELKLKFFNTKSGLHRIIKDQDLCRPGLLLAGFIQTFAEKKIQILGNTEISYLEKLDHKNRHAAFDRLMKANIPCLIISNNHKLSKNMLEIADNEGIAIFGSPNSTLYIYQTLFEYLNDKCAPCTDVHGSLVDVYGIGILFTGRSGIGKSEIALDLVERGHRLVADDVVSIYRKQTGILIGTNKKFLKNIIEIRGVGIIDIKSLFGLRATRAQKRIEVEVHLEDHKPIESYDRLGIDDEYKEYLDVKIPLIYLPIYPGKNITVISEVIALKILQRVDGVRPEKDFIRKLNKKIKENSRISKYLTDDFE